MWFASPPGYYANHTRAEARAQLASLERFSRLLGSFPKASWPTSAAGADVHPVWGHAAPAVAGYAKLARLLVEEEVKRVRVWNDPLGDANAGAAPPAAVSRGPAWDDFGGGTGSRWEGGAWGAQPMRMPGRGRQEPRLCYTGSCHSHSGVLCR
jgi:hypothetical protein